MYKQISIKNIKKFSKEQNLNIAPLTLLYGENSSGKTTLLKNFDIIHNIFFKEILHVAPQGLELHQENIIEVELLKILKIYQPGKFIFLLQS